MKHWLSTRNLSSSALLTLVDRARSLKLGEDTYAIDGRSMALVFFNSSLRTRVSFEAALLRFGGTALPVDVGSDSWNLEVLEGIRMDGDKAEHIKEAARVLSRYVDCIGVRSFAKLSALELDERDEVLAAFAKYATVPVINMESAFEHPCQSLADMLTITEKLAVPSSSERAVAAGKRFVLSWAPHIKALPLAVGHSALLAAAHLGMEITLARPAGYDLAPNVIADVERIVTSNGGSFSRSESLTTEATQAEVLYVKSWGRTDFYGKAEAQRADFESLKNWCRSVQELPKRGVLMHCLPVRRNVELEDSALDSPQSVVIDQAENRLWAQAAILEQVFS